MPRRDDIHKVLIIGSGPIVIGQACEFDYSGTQACKALRSLGYEVVLVVPEHFSLEKRSLIIALGGRVVLTPTEDGMTGAQRRAREIAESTPGAVYVDQFANLANPGAHAATTGPEIYDQMGGAIDLDTAECRQDEIHGAGGDVGGIDGVRAALGAGAFAPETLALVPPAGAGGPGDASFWTARTCAFATRAMPSRRVSGSSFRSSTCSPGPLPWLMSSSP